MTERPEPYDALDAAVIAAAARFDAVAAEISAEQPAPEPEQLTA